MRDIVILAVTAAFFTLCVAYVRWCDHIIGPDPDLDGHDDDADQHHVDDVELAVDETAVPA